MSESQKFHTKSPGLTLRVFVTWGFAAAQSVPGSAVAGSAGGSRLTKIDVKGKKKNPTCIKDESRRYVVSVKKNNLQSLSVSKV